MPEAQTVTGALNAASTGELAWIGIDGSPRVRGVVPLLFDSRPAIAFTYADRDLAWEVASAPRAAVAVTESRATGGSFHPLVATGRPQLTPDPDGELCTEHLIHQELRRYPPSRLLADSVLLRREHWWYLPRLIVTIDMDDVHPLAARTPRNDDGTGGHLLVVAAAGDEIAVRTVTATTPADDAAPIEVALGPSTSEQSVPESGPAALFCQDASFPDMERWNGWTYRGQWDAESASITVGEAPPTVGLEPVPSLLRRWRRHRDLERRCRRALAADS